MFFAGVKIELNSSVTRLRLPLLNSITEGGRGYYMHGRLPTGYVG